MTSRKTSCVEIITEGELAVGVNCHSLKRPIGRRSPICCQLRSVFDDDAGAARSMSFSRLLFGETGCIKQIQNLRCRDRTFDFFAGSRSTLARQTSRSRLSRLIRICLSGSFVSPNGPRRGRSLPSSRPVDFASVVIAKADTGRCRRWQVLLPLTLLGTAPTR